MTYSAAKSKREPMSESEFEAAVAARLRDAVDYSDSEIAPDREKATKYYKGDPFGDEVDGRSKVVSYDVRDTALAIMPSLMRIFFGSEHAVDYDPSKPEDEAFSEQATEYANYIIRRDNDGFLTFYSVFKDALIRKNGLLKCWWEDVETIKVRKFSGVDSETVAALSQEGEITEHTQTPDGLFSVTIKQQQKEGRCKIEALPPEEFLIDRNAKSLSKFDLVAHKCRLPVADVVAMGYDRDLVEAHSSDDSLDTMGERQARNPGASTGDDHASLRKVQYTECFLRIDKDGDGIAELMKVCTLGDEFSVIDDEITDDHPFIDFCAEPEPHVFYGLSLHDVLHDIQRIRSQLLRLALDSLAQAVTPRMGYVQGAVGDLKALQENKLGALIPLLRPDALVPVVTPYVGAPCLDMYRTMGEVRQERTGQNAASMGLEADALQSTSRVAANAIVQSSQSRVELIARIFAEVGMKRLFRRILKLTTSHQDRARTIRLRNQWVPIDPRLWDSDMDVRINVGLGTGNTEERGFFLNRMLEMQQSVLQQMGPNNPICNFDNVRKTLSKLSEVAGYSSPDTFILSDQQSQQVAQQMQQQSQQPPKPDPAELLAQVQAQEIQARIQNSREKLQSEAKHEALKDDRERDYNEARIIIDAAKAGVDPNYVLSVMHQARALTPSGVQ